MTRLIDRVQKVRKVSRIIKTERSHWEICPIKSSKIVDGTWIEQCPNITAPEWARAKFAAADKSGSGPSRCSDSKAYLPRSEKLNTKLTIHLDRGTRRERLGTCEQKLVQQVRIRQEHRLRHCEHPVSTTGIRRYYRDQRLLC